MDKRGTVTFTDEMQAEQYLRALPRGYEGHLYKSEESGKWLVSYRECGHLYIDREGFCTKCREYAPQVSIQ